MKKKNKKNKDESMEKYNSHNLKLENQVKNILSKSKSKGLVRTVKKKPKSVETKRNYLFWLKIHIRKIGRLPGQPEKLIRYFKHCDFPNSEQLEDILLKMEIPTQSNYTTQVLDFKGQLEGDLRRQQLYWKVILQTDKVTTASRIKTTIGKLLYGPDFNLKNENSIDGKKADQNDQLKKERGNTLTLNNMGLNPEKRIYFELPHFPCRNITHKQAEFRQTCDALMEKLRKDPDLLDLKEAYHKRWPQISSKENNRETQNE